ncbi:SRPBCC family protein [Natronoglycomyces albus]|uniref:SRPBCC family protein n=1 Tax=Natronoglycomyces albus TaxID=2811108 RepID=A0A895XVQ0_9ACTN|nr:SRPBCC family protein [Natronoglycomyces albus]QSB06300.1 SRPBCC family protein [Natronoglycomyces albus]
MTSSSSQSIVINADAQRVLDVICDFAAYDQWVEAVKNVEVIETDESGRAVLVGFVLDAGVFKDSYRLRYDHGEPLRVSWVLDEPSNVQKHQVGSYDLEDQGNGACQVTYTLSVDLSIPMLGMFKRKAEKMIMDTALRELKKRAEERQ